ncbi:MAG: cytochrome-c peroxidase [Chitinophagaceae bacterium]
MKRSIVIIVLLIVSVIFFSYGLGSCRKNDKPYQLTLVQLEIPAGFPEPVYKFSDNPLSKEGIELGRQLFYDGRLSLDGKIACASCHQQTGAFGTFEHDLSHGYNGSHTTRNAPVLFNLAWQDKFHWDGEFSSLFDEAVQPITGHIEMAESFNSVIKKLRNDPGYYLQFRNVFNTKNITQEYILKALAQFTGSLVSANSKYDRYKKGLASFTAQEQYGYQLFQAHCNTCHTEPLFTNYGFRNIGLSIDNFLNDFGKMMITNNKADSLKFKTPTLRNVYISSNYMHDGRFNTVSQCINHYRSGIQQSPTLDPILVAGIQLTDTEAINLALFLRTLTDSSFIQDTRFSKP